MKKKYLLFLLLFFCINVTCLGQLADFTLTVTPTNATCPGNGALAFTTSGTNPDATLSFTVYLLPNQVTPIATTPVTSLTGLNPGNYKIVASQALGSFNNSQEQEVTIGNQINPLNYNLTGTNANCLGGGTINVNMVAGNPISYQIITGPVTTPIQATPNFSNLPPGNYNVRVIDTCGQGVVRSFTILEVVSNPNAITVSQNEFPSDWASTPNPHCDSIQVGHRLQILPNSNVVSPLQFVFTVFPPDGSPAVVVTHEITIPSSASGLVPSSTFPFGFIIPYYDSSYNYNLEVIDGCGNSYYRNNNNVNKSFGFNFSPAPLACGFKLTIFPEYFKLPLTVEFLSHPPGFDPAPFNAQHPTFNSSPIVYQTATGAPAGTYVVRITDACGRQATKTTVVQDNVIALSGYSYLNCNQIVGNVFIPTRTIVAASFLQVPTNSGITTPYDLSSFIQPNGTLIITGILTVGTYIISITDSCGKIHTVPLIIMPPVIIPATANYFNGCGENVGSVVVVAIGSPFVNATFISGPTSYQPGFPHDVSQYLVNGAFSMNSIPVGIYVLKTVDNCGNVRNNTLFIGGYFSNTEIEIFRFCSSFDLFVSHTHNNTTQNPYHWLQKQNSITGAWEHPTSGVNYVENTLPNATNSRQIANNQLATNVGDSGHYRILTVTYTAPNGNDSTGQLNCIHVIKEFDVEGTTVINSILNFACSNTISDVYLDVSGSGPFNFSILEKNGVPFSVNNLENPLFTNLETGIYKFQIEDDCGNLTVIIHDVFAPIVFAITPSLCVGQYSTLSVPDFPYLQYEWFKQGAENVILSTDSTLGINALNFNIHSGTYYVNISYPLNPDSCLNRMLSFEISPEMVPNAGDDVNAFICNPSNAIDLNSYLSGNFDENGTWEQINPGGSLNINVWNLQDAESGIYEFRYKVNGLCGFEDEAIITLEILDQIANPEITTATSICAGSAIHLAIINGNTNFSYSWNGPNGFTSTEQNPIIENATVAMSGTYNLTVTAGNCQALSSVEISVNTLPEFIFANENIVICNGQTITIQVLPASVINAAYEYVWYHNDLEITGEITNMIEVNQPGIYKVVISSGDCSISKTISVTENTTLFEVGITAGCKNDLYMVSAVPLNNSFDETTAAYLWSGPNDFYATTQSVDITGFPNGDYSVIVTDVGGCFVENSITINGTQCKIPNAISPNDDGLNDAWDLSGFDIDEVKIFNRWGREVYDEHNYKKQWYGQSYSGNMLPSGTYFYYIKFSSGEETTGWIYLSR